MLRGHQQDLDLLKPGVNCLRRHVAGQVDVHPGAAQAIDLRVDPLLVTPGFGVTTDQEGMELAAPSEKLLANLQKQQVLLDRVDATQNRQIETPVDRGIQGG